MKTLLLIFALLLGTTASIAQTNLPPATNTPPVITNLPPVSGPILKLIDFMSTGSNWVVVPFGLYDEGQEEFGAGLAVGYKISDFFVPTMRIDWVADRLWMPSAHVQLQAPITLMGKVRVTPFVLSGIATPIGGAGDLNGEVIGMFGIGAAVGITDKIGVVYDFEQWTKFEGNQHRFGIFLKF